MPLRPKPRIRELSTRRARGKEARLIVLTQQPGRISLYSGKELKTMPSAIGQGKARETQPAAVSPELIRKMFQTIDKCDWNGLQHVFCEDMTYERPGYEPFIGYERVQQFYRKERVIASGQHLLEKIVINEDCGACWGRFVGLSKTGSPIDERFADAYMFENGKVKTRKSYFFRPAV